MEDIKDKVIDLTDLIVEVNRTSGFDVDVKESTVTPYALRIPYDPLFPETVPKVGNLYKVNVKFKYSTVDYKEQKGQDYDFKLCGIIRITRIVLYQTDETMVVVYDPVDVDWTLLTIFDWVEKDWEEYINSIAGVS
jgi:hypothetical protein